MQKGVRVAVNSDCHFAPNIGEVSSALELLEKIEYPDHMIINKKIDRFNSYLKERELRIERWSINIGV